MGQASTSTPGYGTAKQHEYLDRLAKELGYTDIRKALAELTDIKMAAEGIGVEAASEAIEQLKAMLGSKKVEAPQEGGRKYLTARHLRQIATGQRKIPDELDDDAAWVLARIDLVERFSWLLSNPSHSTSGLLAPPGLGRPGADVNEGGPIPMKQLLDYFKGWDAVAETFKVTVATAKAWGAHLPASRAFEAEIKTHGYFTAGRQPFSGSGR